MFFVKTGKQEFHFHKNATRDVRIERYHVLPVLTKRYQIVMTPSVYVQRFRDKYVSTKLFKVFFGIGIDSVSNTAYPTQRND